MKLLFWISVAGVFYPYCGYPFALWLLGHILQRGRLRDTRSTPLPSVTLIIPVFNEAARIERKLLNTSALRYPADRLQILFVSDGSTDLTTEIINACVTPEMALVELPVRRGKAAALNAGLANAKHEIVVFSDASILLEPDALQHLVRAFQDPTVGCVSGEDYIEETGGEAWYGRYELLLRHLESSLHSIAGASGCFYGQRRSLCVPFTEGMAPDFLSVLRTVEQGARAVTEPAAVGAMTTVKTPGAEFERKVRTVLRGMTTLFAHARLLNPFQYGVFSFILWSHKVIRWMSPICLAGALVTAVAMIPSPVYAAAFILQLLFYSAALAAYAGWAPVNRSLVGKFALYFATVNGAIASAWCQYGKGVRQELWTPSRR